MLLIDTVEDLRSRTGLRATEYDVTQAAGLIRRLLIDTYPLMETGTGSQALRHCLQLAPHLRNHV